MYYEAGLTWWVCTAADSISHHVWRSMCSIT